MERPFPLFGSLLSVIRTNSMTIKNQSTLLLFSALVTLLALTPMVSSVFASSQIEKAAKSDGRPVVKEQQQSDTTDDSKLDDAQTKAKTEEIKSEKNTEQKAKKVNFNSQGLKGFSTKEEGGISTTEASNLPFGSNEEGGYSPQTESIVGFGTEQGSLGLSEQEESFLGMGEEGNEDDSNADGSEDEQMENGDAPLTTDELLALQNAEIINGDSKKREHAIASLNKAIAKWEKFAARGGSGTGVLKRLVELRKMILRGAKDDISTDDDSADSDSDDHDGELGDTSGNSNGNSTGDSDSDNSVDDENAVTEYDDATDDAETAPGTTGSSGNNDTDDSVGNETDSATGETDDGESSDGTSDESSDDSDTDSDESSADETANGRRDNLAPDCSFGVEITKSGIKNGTVALNSFNYFDRADPKTNISSGAKTIRLSNDGHSWREYPADPNLLKRVNWKYGTVDASGNTTIYMQACDNEGNWGNGTSETFQHTFNVE